MKKLIFPESIFSVIITRENVIRNYLEIDEGGVFNEILVNKSKNLQNLNFFKSVNTDIIDGKDVNTKIININVDEKPTEKFLPEQELVLQVVQLLLELKKIIIW